MFTVVYVQYVATLNKIYLGRSIFIFGFIGKSNFWQVLDVFLDLVILVYFNAICIDFCAIKSFICINFV